MRLSFLSLTIFIILFVGMYKQYYHIQLLLNSIIVDDSTSYNYIILCFIPGILLWKKAPPRPLVHNNDILYMLYSICFFL